MSESRISKRDIILYLCLITIGLIWSSIIIGGLFNKYLSPLAIESVAAVICTILLALSIIGLYELHKSKQKSEISNQTKIASAKNLSNSLEEGVQYVDFTGTAICCAMQIFIVFEVIFQKFFSNHPNLTMFRKVTDLIGVGFFCCAMLMLLTCYCKEKNQGEAQVKQSQEGERNITQGIISEQNRKVTIFTVIVLAALTNFTGRALASFVESSNIKVGLHSTLSIGLLMRVVGVLLVTAMLIIKKLTYPKQQLTKVIKDNFDFEIKKGQSI